MDILVQLTETTERALLTEAIQKNIPVSKLVGELIELYFRLRNIENRRADVRKYAEKAGFTSEEDVLNQIAKETSRQEAIIALLQSGALEIPNFEQFMEAFEESRQDRPLIGRVE